MFFGFVGYRDHGISEPFKYDIDANLESFKRYVSKVTAHSDKALSWPGEHLDEPEDVAGGLHMAAALRWDIAGEGTSRVLIHIADAPAHGSKYNGGLTDRYSAAGPGREDCAVALKRLKNTLKVHYSFCKITNKTDMMIKRFNEEASSRTWIETLDMRNANRLAGTVLRTLCSSVMKTVEANGNTLNDFSTICTTLSSLSEGTTEDLEVEKESRPEGSLQKQSHNELNWTCIQSQTLQITAAASVEGVSELKRRYIFRTCYFQDTSTWKCKISPDPFASGNVRWAYHGTIDSGRGPQPYVFKRFMDKGKAWSEHSRANYIEQIKATEVARFLAEQYNQHRNKLSDNQLKPVEFLPAYVAEVQTAAGNKQHFCFEPLLQSADNFTKYNHNAGVWSAAVVNETMVRFAKYTHDATEGHLMITDLQGVELDDKFVLTDPVVLCKDEDLYLPTNLGHEALKANKAAVDKLIFEKKWQHVIR